MKLSRLVTFLHNVRDETGQFFTVRDKPVQVLTEDGDVFDIASLEYDPEAGVTYIKVELAE